MKNQFVFLWLFAAALHCACSTSRLPVTVRDPKIEARVDSLMQLMTLEEKIGQMNQYNGFFDATGPAPKDGKAAQKYEHIKKGYVGSMLNVTGVANVTAMQRLAVEHSRLGIPMLFASDVVHGYQTISPIPLAESASWDLEAIELSARMAAKEASATGLNWTFAPMVDVMRDARWGRVMEGAGEDPYLGSKIAFARVKGFQGENFDDATTILACAKHFAAYGFGEAGRDYNTVDIGASTLHNVVFPPFQASIDAGVRTFMNSFNEVDGIPATGSSWLQRDLLKGAWGFDGFVVSDWGSIAEMIAHGYAKDGKHAAELAARAGSDMDMESYLYVEHLADLVREGKVAQRQIDDAVRRILRVKFELGLFANPYKYCDAQREKSTLGSAEIQQAALDMARKSIVLLKNDRNLLPLQKSGQKIALIGALADDKSSPLGNWRGSAKDGSAVSVREGMLQYSGNALVYEKGADVSVGENVFAREVQINTTDRSGFASAIALAKTANVVVMVLGETGYQSGEGRSRANIDLPGLQQELLEEVFKVNQNIVLVLQNGRPLTIPWAADHIPAIVEAWQLGSQSGHAIAQVLYGDYNPSGKLPMTFPRHVGQLPLYYNHKNTGRPQMPSPGEVFWSHHGDVAHTPLFAFGFGMSYTTFDYSGLNLSAGSFKQGGKIEVSVEVRNSGKVAGREVVQLYLRDQVGSTTRPVRELKGFELVDLLPGQSATVRFTIDESTIRFYTANGKWEAEPGRFEVFVGGSSLADLKAMFDYD